MGLLPNTETARQHDKLKIALENGKIIEGLNENLKSQDNYLISCPHVDAKLPEVCALAGSEPICWSPGMYLMNFEIKFIYSEKATKFCEISTLILTGTTYIEQK